MGEKAKEKKRSKIPCLRTEWSKKDQKERKKEEEEETH